MTRLKTIGNIATESGFKRHQVRHIVERDAVRPVVRAGDRGLMLFDPRSTQRIVRELQRTARCRPNGGVTPT